MALGLGQLAGELIREGREQVAERRVGEPGLRFSRPGHQRSQAVRLGLRERGMPERGLSNAGLPLEDYPGGRGLRQRLMNRMHLGLAADKLLHDLRS